MIKFRYKSIFLYASLQFCGNIEEYFVRNTEKLLVFILMPRVKNKNHFLRIYNKGKLVEEKKIQLPENIFLHYFFWHLTYLKLIYTYFSKKDNVVVITSHPLTLFGMSIQKLLRGVRFVLWTEYFPPISLTLRLFNDLKKFYHARVDYACYFGDRVNKLTNGKILNTERRRTILWGVKPRKIQRDFEKTQYSLLFVGLVKDSQGLELLFEFLRLHKKYSLKIIGVTHGNLYEHYQKMIKDLGISKQVYYPNRFFSTKDLDEISKTCFVGTAPYVTGKTNGTYFVDPGKVKAYTEMGLPVIMTITSAVAPYIKKYKAGELIKSDVHSFSQAILKIKRFYKMYLLGVKKFNDYFYYETYYKKKFDFLERQTN